MINKFPLLLLFFQLFSQEIAPDIQEILEKGYITIAANFEDAPPLNMINKEGKDYGFDTDLAEKIAKELGVKAVLNRNYKTYNEIIDSVSREEADIAISYLSGTLSRAKKVLFTHPYLWLSHCLLINRFLYSKIEDKKNFLQIINDPIYKIGLLKGSMQEDFAKHYFPKSSLIYYKTSEERIDAVENGQVIISLSNEAEARFLSINTPEKVLNIQTVILKNTIDPICIAVNYKKKFLCEWIKRFLEWNKIQYDANTFFNIYKKEVKNVE